MMHNNFEMKLIHEIAKIFIVTAETEVLKLEDPVETLSPGKIGSIIASNMTTFLPPQNLGMCLNNETVIRM